MEQKANYWLQDEEEGFLANEDESVCWVIDEHGAPLRGDLNVAKDPVRIPVPREEQKAASKDHEAVSGAIVPKGEPTRQTVKSIHPIPVTTAKDKEKERIQVARAKEKERTRVTKESPL